MSTDLPSRPRLGDFAMLRRHWVDGVETFAVHDARSGALVLLDRAAFEVVLASDGTRDVEGIREAASRELGAVTEGSVRAVLGALRAEDLLVENAHEGLEASSTSTAASGPTREAAPIDRPLVRLPDYLFHCSGSGHCCRQYASIALTREDLTRARRAGLAGGDSDRVVLPLHGSHFGGRLAMTLVDGQCLQLDADRRCGLHARGGADAKPTACSAYPAMLVDDGVDVRVTPGLECDCVFLSRHGAPDAHGRAELLAGHRVLGDLPAGLSVLRLEREIRINDHAAASASDLSAWSREESKLVPEKAVPMHAVDLARRLEKAGLASSGVVLQERSVHLAMAIRDLAARMTSAAEAAAAWRSPSDRTRIVREAVRDAASSLAGPPLDAALDDEASAADEAFALRTALFGHQLAGSVPMHRALFAFAAELVVARRLRTSVPELGHPIAAVRAAVRAG